MSDEEYIKSEIKELRLFRHDVEGRGIMSLPDRVAKLEMDRHENALKDQRQTIVVESLQAGMAELSDTIKSVHRDLQGVRKLFTVAICVVIVSILLPDDIIHQALGYLIRLL